MQLLDKAFHEKCEKGLCNLGEERDKKPNYEIWVEI